MTSRWHRLMAFTWTSAVLVAPALAGSGYTCHALSDDNPTPVSNASGINAGGAVVGNATPQQQSKNVPALWPQGADQPLQWLVAGPPGTYSRALKINGPGVVVGTGGTLVGNDRPVKWVDGVMIDLGTLGKAQFRYGEALGINTPGQIVGRSEIAKGSGMFHALHATLWQTDGRLIDLGTLAAADAQVDTYSRALAISDSGVIVGESQKKADGNYRAVAWPQPGKIRALPLPPGSWSNSQAASINRSHVIVGSADGWPNIEPLVWRAGQVSVMQRLADAELGRALAINDAGVVVGLSGAGSPGHATVWASPDAPAQDLNLLVEGGCHDAEGRSYALYQADDINAAGMIAATGLSDDPNNFIMRGFVLIPR